jgi:HK97 gp10 family phage protein
MRIAISSDDMRRIQEQLNRSPEVISRRLNAYLLNVAIDMQRDAIKEAPVDTANLQNNINIKREDLRYTITPEAQYAIFAHDGRKPGKMPPIEAVESWANRRGANPYMVARAIGRKGTKGKKFMEIAFDNNKNKAEREGRIMLDRIVAEI